MLTLFPVLRIGAAAISDVAYAASAGTLLNRLWLGRLSICDRRLRACLRACSAILLVILPLQFLLLASSMVGDTSWTDAWQAIPDVAGTHAGRALLLSFCFVPCLLLLSLFAASLARTRGVLIGLSLEAGFLACRAFSGHAASDGDFTLREGMQFLHLCSIAVWGGGIIVAGLITVPLLASASEPHNLVRFGKRLSQTVTVSLAIVIASGLYNSWKGLGGSLSPLPHSPWGRMLLLKLGFVLLVLGHGTRVRFLLRTHYPWTPRHTMIMRRWIRVEALLMLVVLLCSAWLANLPPAGM
jgi:putative copper resistance protein D